MTAALKPVDPRTGEPRRGWAVRLSALAFFLAAGATGVSIFWVYWDAVLRFAEASWLMGRFATEPGSLGRVLLAIAVTAIAIVVAGVTSVVGYYAYCGYSWTRVGGLVAVAVSCLALLLNPVAWAAPPLAAVGAGLLWLPPVSRFFASWQAVRHPEPVYAPPVSSVQYGPLPRFR